jgi:hypothetical protein
MEEPLTELAAYRRRKSEVPDEDLVRFTLAVRAGGSRWDDIAADCGVTARIDTDGVVSQTGAEVLFQATQYAVEELTGSHRYPPLTWPCSGCGQEITDRAAIGRPVHVELGHALGCARLACDQAADEERRREQLPRLILHSEPAVGPMQRHLLRECITDDCPRCGWHGYFHEYIATVNGDWAAVVCDNCFADLHPGITVAVRFFSARWPTDGEPVAVIRQRTRSDHEFPDIGQMMTWRLWWEHTPMLVDDVRGNCTEDIAEIDRESAEQIAAGLAARYWPPEAASLPWVTAVYPR